jgi:hypothetical protein
LLRILGRRLLHGFEHLARTGTRHSAVKEVILGHGDLRMSKLVGSPPALKPALMFISISVAERHSAVFDWPAAG